MATAEVRLYSQFQHSPDLPVRLPDMDAIIELINEGQYDDHLEDLLAAAHGRKREIRGRRRPYGVVR